MILLPLRLSCLGCCCDATWRPLQFGAFLFYSGFFLPVSRAILLLRKCTHICSSDSKANPHRPSLGFETAEGEKKKTVENPQDLLDLLLDRGKKGLSIQRYKGLGEMNPSQLWTTTMDPEKRSLLQVQIEDALEADEIFTILMGDKVEPRREFIQNNALEVRELDI